VTATHPRNSNALYFLVVIVLLLAIIALQVYQIIDNSRPVLRPAQKAPKRAPKLPGAFYEKYRNDETRLDTEQVFYLVI
jgi:hypothetical protein